MKIGIICYPSIGGSGLVATELGINLAQRGHEIHFISYSAPFKLPPFERNISFHSVDPINYPLFNQNLYTFSLTAKIIEVMEDYDLDIIHAHYSIPHSLCAHLAREISKKDFRIVTTLHGTDVTIVGQDKPLFPINKYGIEQSDVVTTVSAFQKNYTKEHFDIQHDIEIIHNFIDTDEFKPADESTCCRSKLAADDEFIVMHISNFRPPKNPKAIIHAFAQASEEIKARLVLVGDGPEILEIKTECRKLKICDKVSYLGKIQNVAPVIAAADCVLQPSYQESFGMVLLEAMACSVPTVSSNIDGIPEVVVHNQTGLMADPDDHHSLGQYLVQLSKDPDFASFLGQNGRQRSIEYFHKDIIIPQYIDCYQ